MNIPKLAFLAVSICFIISCNAQKKSCIEKAYGFMQERTAGTIAVDDNGNPLPLGRDTLIFIYVETGIDNVKWNTAWRNGQSYVVRPVLVKDSPFNPGTNNLTDERLVITPKKGNRLWELQLEQSNAPRQKTSNKNSPANELMLEGECKKVNFRYPIKKFVMLQSIPSV